MAVMWAYIYYDDGAVAKAAALFAVIVLNKHSNNGVNMVACCLGGELFC